MMTFETDLYWARWVELGRLQSELLERGAEVVRASVDGACMRGERLLEFWFTTPWPLLASRLDAPLAAGERLADYLEDEARNGAQALMLADWELRDWGGRIARTVEGGPDRAVAVDRTTT